MPATIRKDGAHDQMDRAKPIPGPRRHKQETEMTIIKTAVEFIAFMILWIAIVGAPTALMIYLSLREIIDLIVAS